MAPPPPCVSCPARSAASRLRKSSSIAAVGEPILVTIALTPVAPATGVVGLLKGALPGPAVALRGGVWYINGLYRHGYLCAPALVDELVHQLLAA